MKDELVNYLDSVGEDWNYILPEALFEDMKNNKDYFLLDVRREDDYEQNHIKGSHNMLCRPYSKSSFSNS